MSNYSLLCMLLVLIKYTRMGPNVIKLLYIALETSKSQCKEYETCYYSIQVANYGLVAPGVISAFHVQIPVILQVYI